MFKHNRKAKVMGLLATLLMSFTLYAAGDKNGAINSALEGVHTALTPDEGQPTQQPSVEAAKVAPPAE